MRLFDGELTRDTNVDSHTSRTTQIMAIRMITPNQAIPMNRTAFGRFCRSYLNGSGFGHTSGCSRLRPDPRLFMLHAAGGHERQSHSGDNNKRLHDLPRWENLSGHFLTLSESGAFSLRSLALRSGVGERGLFSSRHEPLAQYCALPTCNPSPEASSTQPKKPCRAVCSTLAGVTSRAVAGGGRCGGARRWWRSPVFERSP